ncbi:hypothetical protein FMM05_13300 [Flavobacterium zepuense]|uniref:Uncharacterized protein n=1 Tax=Flavobacterium zepuense TaxID=2593302 RepID=A0A552UZJ9_9FLAO|nr:hypothetical protein [Flavobacterium zepuense]TRW23631.1 hypothetical protein FMM05_13300 [Flavobacterium zepuense]
MNEKRNKIADNPSYSKLQKDVVGYSLLGKFLRLFTLFSPSDSAFKKALSELPELKKQTEYFLQLPDKFNSHFARQGWIAHESMNIPVMENAIEFADQGDVKKSEEILSDYFTSSEINWLLNRFRLLPEFSIRYDLIKTAYQNTLERRYDSCIPILLMVIDGATNDISKSKGFFNDQTDLSAWDSIAAHSTGLEAIRDIFNTTRKKTNPDEVFMPYRNGILHGRDVNYGNKYVAGKCWCTLFALNDWAQALQKQKVNPPVTEKPKTLKDNLREIANTFKEYGDHKKWHKEISEEIANWQPRNFIDTVHNSENFQDFTPEKEVYELLVNWQNKNYGKIAGQKHYFGSQPVSFGIEAGKIRRDFEDKVLQRFKILSIKDEAPAISEITAEIKYSIQDQAFTKEIIFRMICQAMDGKAAINGQENIKWAYIDNFIYGLYI